MVKFHFCKHLSLELLLLCSCLTRLKVQDKATRSRVLYLPSEPLCAQSHPSAAAS